ncbi:MAG TPA: hypothetical protein VD908_14035 [Cytophagales bacterium]|nr:hypothetical protein [Cytophagales bacterium]
MDAIEDLNNLLKLLKANPGLKFSRQILNEVEEGEIYYVPSLKLKTVEILSLLETRKGVQEEVMKKETVFNYSDVLSGLQKEIMPEVFNCTLTTRTSTYIIYVSWNKNRIIGILNSTNTTLEKSKELYNVYNAKGLEVRGIFYKKNFM